MNFKLTASMMCADYRNLEKEVRSIDEGGIDSFHIDIMDGRYVPNFAMSLNDMKCIRSLTDKPLDVHLMIEHPNNSVKLFTDNLRKGDTVYIHPEAEYHPSTTLQKIIDAGMIPGIAINPGTSIETVYEMLRIVKKVLVMAVNLDLPRITFLTGIMLLVADSAFLSRIFDNIKIMFKSDFIGTLSDELQGFVIAVPAYPVKVIRANGDVVMNVIGINVSADDYRSVYSKHLFRPFRSYPMCFFGRNA